MAGEVQGWGGSTSTSFLLPHPLVLAWHPHLGEAQPPAKPPAPVGAVSCPCCQLQALWEAPLFICTCGKARN